MRTAHSYEEPAYDVYPLKPTAANAGEGRIGRLPQAMALGKLAEVVKKSLNAAALQVVGNPSRQVEKVAIVCGAGGELLQDAMNARADVFLTGEMRFHDALAAEARGVGVLMPGHYATERFAMEGLAAKMQADLLDLRVWPSQRERDPIQ
jgi:putative NIF3 family GTP cyclohydrolase 1 type 2